MNRREFFTRGLHQVAKTAVQVTDGVVNQHARHWLRPPYALAELEFLLACSRCDACVEACPHQVIFKLPPGRGARVMGTPALDLLNRACHLCEDWPCVDACKSQALILPEAQAGEAAPLPVLARVEINRSRCLPYRGPECGACASACPVAGALVWKMGKPEINPTICSGCGLCREACILEQKAIDIHSIDTSLKDTGC